MEYPPDFLQKYTPLERLGSGGMGFVVRARQHALDRDVVVKFLKAEWRSDQAIRQRFLNEARICALFSHPNLVPVFDVDEKARWMVFGWVPGEPVSRIQERERTLSIERAIEIVDGAAAGLEHAHSHNVVHRDIKPDNILVAEDGVVKVLDFGIASARRQLGSLTGEGTIIGTPGYMSPEQVLSRETSPATDIYGLAATLYDLLTGGPPFAGDDVSAVLQAVVSEPPASPRLYRRELSDRLERVLLKGLEKDPSRRYQNVSQFRRALDGARGAVESSGLHEAVRVASRSAKTIALGSEKVPRRPAGPTVAVGGRTMVSGAHPVASPARSRTAIGAALAGIVLLGSAGLFISKSKDAPAPEQVSTPIQAEAPRADIDSPDPALRGKAVDELAATPGRASRARLTAMLAGGTDAQGKPLPREPVPMLRLKSIDALVKRRETAAVLDLILSTLDEKDEGVRRAAADAIHVLGDFKRLVRGGFLGDLFTTNVAIDNLKMRLKNAERSGNQWRAWAILEDWLAQPFGTPFPTATAAAGPHTAVLGDQHSLNEIDVLNVAGQTAIELGFTESGQRILAEKLVASHPSARCLNYPHIYLFYPARRFADGLKLAYHGFRLGPAWDDWPVAALIMNALRAQMPVAAAGLTRMAMYGVKPWYDWIAQAKFWIGLTPAHLSGDGLLLEDILRRGIGFDSSFEVFWREALYYTLLWGDSPHVRRLLTLPANCQRLEPEGSAGRLAGRSLQLALAMALAALERNPVEVEALRALSVSESPHLASRVAPAAAIAAALAAGRAPPALAGQMEPRLARLFVPLLRATGHLELAASLARTASTYEDYRLEPERVGGLPDPEVAHGRVLRLEWIAIERERGNLSGAVDVALELTKENAFDFDLWMPLSDLLEGTGQDAAKVKAKIDAIKLQGRSVWARLPPIVIDYETGNADRALERLRDLQSAFSKTYYFDSAVLVELEGKCLERLGRKVEAIEAYRFATLARDCLPTQRHRLEARIAVVTGDADSARTHLRLALVAHPTDWRSLLALGDLERDSGNDGKPYYERALAISRALLEPAARDAARSRLER